MGVSESPPQGEKEDSRYEERNDCETGREGPAEDQYSAREAHHPRRQPGGQYPPRREGRRHRPEEPEYGGRHRPGDSKRQDGAPEVGGGEAFVMRTQAEEAE